MKVERFCDATPEAWDGVCLQLGVSSPWHTWDMLDYYAKSCGAENLSFLLRNDQGKLIAVCPLFLAEENHPGLGVRKVSSIAGAPLPSPLLCRDSDENRIRRNLRELDEAISGLCVTYGIGCTKYVYRSYSYIQRGSHFFETGGLFDLLALGYMPTIFQSIAIDLRRKKTELEAELSQFHRKEIRKAQGEGQRLVAIDLAVDRRDIERYFAGYQSAHFAAAGRQTRPQSSFDTMSQMLFSGKATLFVNVLEDCPISYLYCGQRHGVAFGWSQVNVLPAKGVSPRHFLEWAAINHYLGQGYILYDVGTKHYVGQLGIDVSKKQLSIGFFKERFGGVLSPEVHYKKFYDKELCQFELGRDLDAFSTTFEAIKIV